MIPLEMIDQMPDAKNAVEAFNYRARSMTNDEYWVDLDNRYRLCAEDAQSLSYMYALVELVEQDEDHDPAQLLLLKTAFENERRKFAQRVTRYIA